MYHCNHIDNKWEIPIENIRISTKLGRGEFGSLYDAEMKSANGQLVRVLVKVSVCSCDVMHNMILYYIIDI